MINMEVLIPLINGQYSGFKNELLLSNDKMFAHYNTILDNGICQTRAGNTLVKDLGSGDTLGMHDAVFADGTHTFIANIGNVLKNINDGSTIGSKTWSSGQNTEYANFINKVFIVNGTDAMGDWDGSTTFDSSNITGAPSGTKYIKRYGARLYTARNSSNPLTVYYSSIPSSDAITWTTDTDFYNVESSGDFITGLEPARNTLMVFTNEDIEIRYFSFARLGVLKGKGILSNRSIITKKGITYWFHHDIIGEAGIMAYSGTGADTAELISNPIQDVFDNMSDSNNDKAVAWAEGENLIWYIGDISMDYGTINAVCYNTKTRQWTTWYLPYTIKAASQFLNGTTLEKGSYIGDNAATVYQRTGVSDNGTAIESFFITNQINNTQPNIFKNWQSINVKSLQKPACKIQYRTDDMLIDDWKGESLLSKLKGLFGSKDYNQIKINGKGIDLQVKVSLIDTAPMKIKYLNLEYLADQKIN